jgi:hypothetical protein
MGVWKQSFTPTSQAHTKFLFVEEGEGAEPEAIYNFCLIF